MKINPLPCLMAVGALVLGAACGSTPKSSVPVVEAVPQVIGGNPTVKAMPRATVYRMTGAAGPQNVAVQVNDAGEIVSFPDPRDLQGGEPIELGDGWLLDRRGIGASSRFTRWTFAEYAAMDAPPSLAEIRAAIIPDARATEIHRLGMTPTQAAADTAAVKALIRAF